MWLVGHAQVGWFLARAGGLEERDRRLVTVAGVLPDLDAVTLLGGLDSYLGGHHVYLHNLSAAVVLPLAVAAFARRRAVTCFAALAAVLLHFLSDGFGLLELRPLWPFSTALWWPNQARFAVAFASEVAVPFLLLAWSAAVFRRERVSVLESLSPRLDARLARFLARQAAADAAPSRRLNLVEEVVADLLLLAVDVALVQVVLTVVGTPSWRLAAVFGAVATVVLRWLLPALGRRWLRRYAAGFGDG
jgi:membrane-bound metal-dependent hydrolase YbcI (DUF457 family)